MEHDFVIIDSHNRMGLKNKFPINARRVKFPTFEVVNNPTIRLGDVKKRLFTLMDRSVQKARQEIMAAEDEKIFAALDAASGNKKE